MLRPPLLRLLAEGTVPRAAARWRMATRWRSTLSSRVICPPLPKVLLVAKPRLEPGRWPSCFHQGPSLQCKHYIQTGQPRAYGYAGTESIGPYWLGDEDIRRVLDRVRDAVSQMPRGTAGIAVIDTTMADFDDVVDVEDACYRELRGWAMDGGWKKRRAPGTRFSIGNFSHIAFRGAVRSESSEADSGCAISSLDALCCDALWCLGASASIVRL